MAEKEYIERGALVLKVRRHLMPNVDIDGTVSVEDAVRYFLKLLDAQPTADVVEVVRCKDCKYYEIHKPSVTLNCEREGRMIPMNPDDFCKYGKRRNEESNG